MRCDTKSAPTTSAQHHISKFFNIPNQHVKLLKQTHSDRIVTVTEPLHDTTNTEADGLVSSSQGLPLLIRTADCAPVLFCDEKNLIIGAAHAGWRGAFSGVIQNTAEAMKKLGAQTIKALIGPSIRQENYEVDAQFFEKFTADDHSSERFFIHSTKQNHYLFDLQGYCGAILEKLQIEYQDISLDTYKHSQLFHSYRRSYHQSLTSHKQNNTQFSGIMIEAS